MRALDSLKEMLGFGNGHNPEYPQPDAYRAAWLDDPPEETDPKC